MNYLCGFVSVRNELLQQELQSKTVHETYTHRKHHCCMACCQSYVPYMLRHHIEELGHYIVGIYWLHRLHMTYCTCSTSSSQTSHHQLKETLLCSCYIISEMIFRPSHLKWHYAQLRKNGSEKLKFKITVYFLTSVYKMVLNIVSSKLQHKNINKHKDRCAFDLHNIKRMGQSFYISTIFIL